MSRIAIFGGGYVGLVTGACFAQLGHEVVVRDVLPEKIDALRRGEVPIYEPGLEELLAKNGDRLRYTLDVREALDGAEFLFVCVDTPPLYSGDADLSRVWTVVDELPENTSATIVMKSTVPVGTGEKVRAALDSRGLATVGYVSNPEFTAEGTAVRDFLQPDRIVVGAFDEADGDAVEALHTGIDAPIVRADVHSAEMIKLAANAFLMTRVSFINEIANVCELVGADVQSVAEGLGLDHRLGPHFLRAGLGYGGSCLRGAEQVVIRRDGDVESTTLEDLFEDVNSASARGFVHADQLEVLSWQIGERLPEFMSVAALTRRWFTGDLLGIRHGLGRRVRCTPDHPFVVASGADGVNVRIKLASELDQDDWLPITPARTLRVWLQYSWARRQAVEAGIAMLERSPLLEQRHADVTWHPLQGISRHAFDGFVYSLEVPGSETFVTTCGLITHNCFPKDSLALKQLAANSGYHFQLLTAVIEVNELQKRRVIQKLQKHLGRLRGKTVALLGLAFKPNTDDTREAPSLVLASRLLAEGADVRAWDPVARPELQGVTIVDSPLEAVSGADAAVIVTEWPELADLATEDVRAAMRHPLIIDGRNLLDPAAVRAAGFAYEGIGRAVSPLDVLPETPEREPEPFS